MYVYLVVHHFFSFFTFLFDFQRRIIYPFPILIFILCYFLEWFNFIPLSFAVYLLYIVPIPFSPLPVFFSSHFLISFIFLSLLTLTMWLQNFKFLFTLSSRTGPIFKFSLILHFLFYLALSFVLLLSDISFLRMSVSGLMERGEK